MSVACWFSKMCVLVFGAFQNFLKRRFCRGSLQNFLSIFHTKIICKGVHLHTETLCRTKRAVGDLTFAEGRGFRERDRGKKKGEEFLGRSVAWLKIRKEGLGTVGLLQDVVSGDRKTAELLPTYRLVRCKLFALILMLRVKR